MSDKDTVAVIVGAYVAFAVFAAAIVGWGGVLAVGSMALSCWYGYAVGHARGWRHSSEWRMERERRR